QKLLDDAGRARAKQMVDARAAKGPGDIVKEGFSTGGFAINPFSGARMPVWIGNFVLMDYGTGAIMAVPAHDERDFEFCTQYKLQIVPVIRPADGSGAKLPYCDYGIVENSGEYSGLASEEARLVMSERAKREGFGEPKITYRLKDWGI